MKAASAEPSASVHRPRAGSGRQDAASALRVERLVGRREHRAIAAELRRDEDTAAITTM